MQAEERARLIEELIKVLEKRKTRSTENCAAFYGRFSDFKPRELTYYFTIDYAADFDADYDADSGLVAWLGTEEGEKSGET